MESEGGIVHYRNVRLKELPDTPIEPEHIAIADRGYRCLYTGVDFSGWKEAQGWESKDWVMVSKADAKPLETDEIFSGDFGFIVDVKLGEKSGAPKLTVRGVSVPLDATLKGAEPVGKWNRIEGTIKGDILSLKVNETEAGDFSTLTEKGPIALVPDGPVDWANPYVRALP